MDNKTRLTIGHQIEQKELCKQVELCQSGFNGLIGLQNIRRGSH